MLISYYVSALEFTIIKTRMTVLGLINFVLKLSLFLSKTHLVSTAVSLPMWTFFIVSSI